MYLVDPLEKLLPDLVDFDLIASGKPQIHARTDDRANRRDAVFRQHAGRDRHRARFRIERDTAVLSRRSHRRRVLLGRRRLFEFADRSRVRRGPAAEFRGVRRANLAHAGAGAGDADARLHARKGHYVRKSRQKPHHASSPASSHAPHGPGADRHAARGDQELAPRQRARRLELQNDHAYRRDQQSASERRDQCARLRFFARRDPGPLAGRLCRHLPHAGAPALE